MKTPTPNGGRFVRTERTVGLRGNPTPTHRRLVAGP